MEKNEKLHTAIHATKNLKLTLEYVITECHQYGSQMHMIRKKLGTKLGTGNKETDNIEHADITFATYFRAPLNAKRFSHRT